MTAWAWWLLGVLLSVGALVAVASLAWRLWVKLRTLGRGMAAAGERLAAAAPLGAGAHRSWDDEW